MQREKYWKTHLRKSFRFRNDAIKSLCSSVRRFRVATIKERCIDATLIFKSAGQRGEAVKAMLGAGFDLPTDLKAEDILNLR